MPGPGVNVDGRQRSCSKESFRKLFENTSFWALISDYNSAGIRKKAQSNYIFRKPHRYFYHLKNFFIEVQLIYHVVAISAVQQTDSVTHIETFFFNILFHYGLS